MCIARLAHDGEHVNERRRNDYATFDKRMAKVLCVCVWMVLVRGFMYRTILSFTSLPGHEWMKIHAYAMD